MFVTGARGNTVIGYVQSGAPVEKSSVLNVTRSESLDGAYLIGAQRRSTSMLNMVTVEDRKSSDGFEDDEGDRPGPNFKIGCRRKLHLP